MFIFHYLELRLMFIGNTVRNWEVRSDYEPDLSWVWN